MSVSQIIRMMVAVVAMAAVAAPVAALAGQKPPVRVGGTVKAPVKIKDVAPVYPDLARQARLQGMVLIEATIDRDGSVVDTKVLRPVPLLESAAVEAVKQWKYEPTLLDGEPVPVLMVVTVSFTLKGAAQASTPEPAQAAASMTAAVSAARAVATSTSAQQKPPVRVGGAVKEPKKIKDVAPVYPDEARQAGVQGMVIIETTIGTDGAVSDVKVLRSVALLEMAAVEAVKQWKYEPTLIDGEPVSVLMVVTVNFTLK